MNGKDVEAVVKVAAECALGDELCEIAVGGGDDADVNALCAIAAEALELLLLQNAEEFGLKVERKVGDFVEEESAVIGQFEAADFLRESAGESAALVAEKFGFEKPAGDGGAIDFDESALAARAKIVNGAGDELFAGAGFSGDKDGGSSGSDEFDLREGSFERRAVADNFFEIEFAANFFLEIELFLGKLVIEHVNLFEGQSVFHGDSDLRGDLLEQFDVLRRKSILASASEIESAECAALRNERNAADGLHAFRAERANDFVGESIDLGAAGEKRLARGEADAGRSGFERDRDFLVEEARAAGKIERVDLQEAGGGVAKGEAGEIVMDDAFERRNDAAE